jgi:predicted transcriptional regulator
VNKDLQRLKKLIQVFGELDDKYKKVFLSLNNFQIEIIHKLFKSKELTAQELLKDLKTDFSTAQQYRYLKELRDMKLCKHSQNKYSLA